MSDNRYFLIEPGSELEAQANDWFARSRAVAEHHAKLVADCDLDPKIVDRVYLDHEGAVISFHWPRNLSLPSSAWKEVRRGIAPKLNHKIGKERAALMAACPKKPLREEASKWIGWPRSHNGELLRGAFVLGVENGPYAVGVAVSGFFSNVSISAETEGFILEWPTPEGTREITLAEWRQALKRGEALSDMAKQDGEYL